MKRLLPLLFLSLPTLMLAETNLVDHLTPAQITEALGKIRSTGLGGNLTPVELDRATLDGLLGRMNSEIQLVDPAAQATARPAEIFRSEMLPRSIAYFRLGDLNEENVRNLSSNLIKQSRAAGVILDLRATRRGDSYDLATRVINLFCPKGVPYFALNGDGRTNRTFAGKADPVFSGMVVVLINGDCHGPAEVIAASLQQRAKALLTGTRPPGRTMEYTSVPLANLTLKVATARVVLTDGGKDLRKELIPDLPVTIELTREREVLAASAKDGVAKYIFEVERPHMNEASLVAGRNPELDTYQQQQARVKKPEETPLLDTTLQRALDTVTTVLISRSPKTTGR